MNKVAQLTKQSSVRIFITIYAVLFLIGCAKKTQFEEVWESGLNNCAEQCHSPGGTAEDGPDMTNRDTFYDGVVNKTIQVDYPVWQDRDGDCDSVPLIDPGNAENSLVVANLVLSISDMQSCETAYNVHELSGLTDRSWDDLIKWINDGAPRE